MCSIIRTDTVKIRKARRCWGCTEVIPKGTLTHVTVSADMGEISSGYWCEKCLKLPADNSDGGCYEYGAFAGAHDE